MWVRDGPVYVSTIQTQRKKKVSTCPWVCTCVYSTCSSHAHVCVVGPDSHFHAIRSASCHDGSDYILHVYRCVKGRHGHLCVRSYPETLGATGHPSRSSDLRSSLESSWTTGCASWKSCCAWPIDGGDGTLDFPTPGTFPMPCTCKTLWCPEL